MSKALQNVAKLRAWADVTAYGADATGATAADSAFTAALATGLPVRVPPGTFLLNSTVSKVLATAQDFAIVGDGPEVSRLLFASGAGLTVSYNGNTTSFGDQTSIIVRGLGLETNGAGSTDALTITNTQTGVVNDTEANVLLEDLAISGSDSSKYWTTGIALTNVAWPAIKGIKIEDGQRRTIGISLNTSGSTYSAVDVNISDYRAWEVLTAVKVRGKCEGISLSQMTVVGCSKGVDWVATIVAGAKKPLLLMDGCHIDNSSVEGTAVALTDVSQAIVSDCLIYIKNSTLLSTYAFDFAATTALSSENHRLNGVTIIGQGSRVGALSTAVRCGADVYGVTIDATIENVDTCVATQVNNRTQVSPGSRLVGYNTRGTNLWDATGTTAGGVTGGVSVDGSLQFEKLGTDNYQRTVYREDLRVGTYVHTAAAANETVAVTLATTFRTGMCGLVQSFGSVPTTGAVLFADTTACTASQLVFRLNGMTTGTAYRINYIAYGY